MSWEERIKQHIDALFSGAPDVNRVNDLKNEIYLNTLDRYRDLLAEGKPEEEAYRSAIGGIGDVRELIRSLNTTATAVGSAPAAAVADASAKGKPAAKSLRRTLRGQVDSILWMLMLTLYFELSFATGKWHITWILFLIAPAVESLIHAIWDYTTRNRPEVFYLPDTATRRLQSNLSTALWTLTVAAYILISFYTGRWYVTWVMFLLAVALENLICILTSLSASRKTSGTSDKEGLSK